MRKIVLIALACVLLAGCGELAPAPTPTPSPIVVTPAPTQAPAAEGIAYETVTREEKDALSEKTASYPVTGVENIDRDALRIVDAAFAEAYGDATMPDFPGYGHVSFAVERNDAVFSVVYNIATYYAGAAHGTSANIAKNYQMPGGKPLLLADLFIDPTFVLRLSDLSWKQLQALEIDVPEDKQYLEPDAWFQEGVSPDEINFENFLPKPNGLQFIFSDYQVAPYVVGEVRLTIPWEDIEDIMKQDLLAVYRK